MQSDITKLGTGRTMLVNGITAGQQGLTVGRKVALQTPNGLKDYTVVGVATDYLNAKLSTIYISQDNLKEDFNVTSNVLVLANAKPGAPKPAVRAALGRLIANYPQFVAVRLGHLQSHSDAALLADVRRVRHPDRDVRPTHSARVVEHAGDQRSGPHT